MLSWCAIAVSLSRYRYGFRNEVLSSCAIAVSLSRCRYGFRRHELLIRCAIVVSLHLVGMGLKIKCSHDVL